MFPVHATRRRLKTQQSHIILDPCLRKTQLGKSHSYRDAIRFEIKAPFSKRKAGVSNGLVWIVGLTVEIKLRFQNSLGQFERFLTKTRQFSDFIYIRG